jgi:hypothetical protein
MSNKIFIYLTGGLGNQLFQYAAGLSLNTDDSIYLEDKIGKPRGEHRADIFDFSLPRVDLNHKSLGKNVFVRKSLSYTLRIYSNPKRDFIYSMIRSGVVVLTSLICSLKFKKKIRVIPNYGVGFDEKLKVSKGNNFLLGYFQTYKIPNSLNVKENLAKITLENNNSFVQECKDTAENSQPLIVHIRLGDYLSEKSFGIPDLTYYQKAIDLQISRKLFKEIWVFSDEISKAMHYLPKGFSLPVIYKDDPESSPAQILEAMRYGRGYVIANSTFSWWAATLSYSKESHVVAPTPWFKEGASPLELIPTHWTLIDAYRDDSAE